MKVSQNAPSTCSEPGGKQWQHSIRGHHNYMYEGTMEHGDHMVTQYQSRIFNKEHSLNNALKLFLNEPIGACGLIFERMKFQVRGPV